MSRPVVMKTEVQQHEICCREYAVPLVSESGQKVHLRGRLRFGQSRRFRRATLTFPFTAAYTSKTMSATLAHSEFSDLIHAVEACVIRGTIGARLSAADFSRHRIQSCIISYMTLLGTTTSKRIDRLDICRSRHVQSRILPEKSN